MELKIVGQDKGEGVIDLKHFIKEKQQREVSMIEHSESSEYLKHKGIQDESETRS
jgi:hypothetical protein